MPADSPTGYCKHRNHKKCPYRPGGKCANGIALTEPEKGFYMCPCDCHAVQAEAVATRRAELLPAKPKKVGQPAKAKAGVTIAEKQHIRRAMVAHLEKMDLTDLIAAGMTESAIREFIDSAWIKYIDPDRNKARRDATHKGAAA